MKYLNLTRGFNPADSNAFSTVAYDSFYFYGGEPHIKLKANQYSNEFVDVCITTRINSFDDLGMLAVAVDALQRVGWLNDIYLFIPYFPGARQDRVAVLGEALTVKVYADIINAMADWKEIGILDPHSDVAPALLNNCKIYDNYKLVEHCWKLIQQRDESVENHMALISPDAGANKKVLGLANCLNLDTFVKCDKVRDVNNGNITGFQVFTDDLEGKDCVIVDDICDGGGTFLGLADELLKKNAGRLYLIVSHGIFSKGTATLLSKFTHIYTSDSISADQNTKGLTVITKNQVY